MADRIQLRRDTAANWTAYNPILLEGEPGIELDTDQWKMGDGVHTWSQLSYRGGECVQQKGQSTTVAMSQKAVTDELNSIIDAVHTVGEFVDLPQQEEQVQSGYYYSSSGELVANSGSLYYRLNDLSSYVNMKLVIRVDSNTNFNNARYILLMDSSNNVKTRATIGGIAQNGCTLVFNVRVASGDYLLVSWSDDLKQPMLYATKDTCSSLKADINVELTSLQALINQYASYKNTVDTTIGTDFINKLNCNFSEGDTVYIMVTDANDCINNHRVNLYINGGNTSIIDTNTLIKLTLGRNTQSFWVDRSGASIVKQGQITLSVIKDSVLPYFLLGILESCNKNIAAVDARVDGVKSILLGNILSTLDLSGYTSGYYIAVSGGSVITVENPSSAYKIISLDDYVGGFIEVELYSDSGVLPTNARCIVLSDSEGNAKEYYSLGKIVSNNYKVTFKTAISQGDKVYVSFEPNYRDVKSVVINDGNGYEIMTNIRLDALEEDVNDLMGKVASLYHDMYGGSGEQTISLDGESSGYYYKPGDNNEVVLNSNSDSKYKEITLNLDGELKVVASAAEMANNGRYIILQRMGVTLEYINLAAIVSTQPNRTYTFTQLVQTGDKLYVSWSITNGKPTVILEESSASVKEYAVESYNELFGSSIDQIYLLPRPFQTGYYYGPDGSLVANENSIYIPEITIDSDYYGQYLKIEVAHNTAYNNGRYYLLVDSDGNIKDYVTNGQIAQLYNYKYTFNKPVAQGDKLLCSWDNRTSDPRIWFSEITVSLIQRFAELQEKMAKTIYISTTGSDMNIGTISKPMKTINAALDAGANEIIINEGEYSQNIDFKKCKTSRLLIKGATKKRIIFRQPGTCISDDGSETLVSGYSNVYKIENAPNPSYNLDGALWLFFDGLDDVTTQITADEIHPCQRGMFYRCECTKSEGIRAFMKGTMSLSDALDEIESATTYKWIYDTNTSTLYFNRAADTATYPLYRASGRFFTPKVDLSLEMSNIEFRYAECNLYYLNMAKIVNCASNYSYAGTWVYDYSIGIEFVNCESCRAFAINGDGFNGHATDMSTFTRAKRCQVRIVDCWSHDNYDDGYSDHEYAETVIEGGLYEYNGKAGITPSYGSHCTCKNVYSRHNYAGFYYCGNVNDAGNNGQLICYDCVSEQNDRGGIKSGFAISNNNQAFFVNCMAINENNGFNISDTCRAKLINCKSLGCTTPLNKSANATVIIQNGNPITDE